MRILRNHSTIPPTAQRSIRPKPASIAQGYLRQGYVLTRQYAEALLQSRYAIYCGQTAHGPPGTALADNGVRRRLARLDPTENLCTSISCKHDLPMSHSKFPSPVSFELSATVFSSRSPCSAAGIAVTSPPVSTHQQRTMTCSSPATLLHLPDRTRCCPHDDTNEQRKINAQTKLTH